VHFISDGYEYRVQDFPAAWGMRSGLFRRKLWGTPFWLRVMDLPALSSEDSNVER
jgi:hypothetical protein